MGILFNVFFCVAFAVIVIAFFVILVQVLKKQRANRNAPRLTVDAVVVAKREAVSQHQQPMAGDITGAHGYMTSTSSSYYATFEVESGDRMELEVGDTAFGDLREGDRGRLTFQGTRMLSFERR